MGRQHRSKPAGYLPSLDGWRAFAILGVLMTHDQVWTFGRWSNAPFKDLGGSGVQLFFAISGLLICTRILEEEAIVGRFRLKGFYIRRLLRIQPALLAYLAVVAALTLSGVVFQQWRYWWGALLLYSNYLYHAADPLRNYGLTGHTWTLAVEEHFYLLLSLLLFFFRRHRIAIFSAVIAVSWVVQHIASKHGLYSLDDSGRRTQWVFLLLLVPSLLALCLRVDWVRHAVMRFLQPWVAYALTFGFILLARSVGYHRHPAAGPFWSWSAVVNDHVHLLYFGFALWVIATMLHPRSVSTRFLEMKPLRWLGRLSYSLYLWHVLFFVPAILGSGITSKPLLLLSERPWKYVASLAAAALSYYLLERPMMRLGHRAAPPATAGHRDLEPQPLPIPSA